MGHPFLLPGSSTATRPQRCRPPSSEPPTSLSGEEGARKRGLAQEQEGRGAARKRKGANKEGEKTAMRRIGRLGGRLLLGSGGVTAGVVVGVVLRVEDADAAKAHAQGRLPAGVGREALDIRPSHRRSCLRARWLTLRRFPTRRCQSERARARATRHARSLAPSTSQAVGTRLQREGAGRRARQGLMRRRSGRGAPAQPGGIETAQPAYAMKVSVDRRPVACEYKGLRSGKRSGFFDALSPRQNSCALVTELGPPTSSSRMRGPRSPRVVRAAESSPSGTPRAKICGRPCLWGESGDSKMGKHSRRCGAAALVPK